MRKNKTMRFASMLLVLTLLSTSVISGTFAKYVTSGSATDSARVAKWGVEVTSVDSTGNGLFAKTYTATGATDDTITNSVSSSTEDKLVAPGTSGTLTNVTVKGTPEVAVKVSYDAELTLTGWTINTNEFYCPLVFKVTYLDGTPVEVKMDATNNTAALLETAVEAAIETYTEEYVPNTNLETTINDDIKVEWSWDFDDNGVGTNDAKDTALGNLAKAPTVTLAVTTTVTQID